MGVLSSPKSLDHLTPHFFVPRTYGRMVFTQGITYTLLLFCTYGRMVFTQVICYTFLLYAVHWETAFRAYFHPDICFTFLPLLFMGC